MDWKCGSSSRVPTLQMQSPEFKPQSHQKKKKSSKYGELLKLGDKYLRGYSLLLFGML
jgi:hypothetical protein